MSSKRELSANSRLENSWQGTIAAGPGARRHSNRASPAAAAHWCAAATGRELADAMLRGGASKLYKRAAELAVAVSGLHRAVPAPGWGLGGAPGLLQGLVGPPRHRASL
jgi:hypothetical protein